jgi:hypothetical protein
MKKFSHFLILFIFALVSILACKKTDLADAPSQVGTNLPSAKKIPADALGIEQAKAYHSKITATVSQRSEGSDMLATLFASMPLIWERADTVMYMGRIPLIMVPFKGYPSRPNNTLQAVFYIDTLGSINSDILMIQGDSINVRPTANFTGRFTHFTWAGEISLWYDIENGIIQNSNQSGFSGTDERCCIGIPITFVPVVPAGGGSGEGSNYTGCQTIAYWSWDADLNRVLIAEYWCYDINGPNTYNPSGLVLVSTVITAFSSVHNNPPYGTPSSPSWGNSGGGGGTGGGSGQGDVNPLDLNNDNIIDYYETDELDDAIIEQLTLQFLSKHKLPNSLYATVFDAIETLFQNSHQLTPAQLHTLIMGSLPNISAELYQILVNQFALENGLNNQQKQVLLADRILFGKLRSLTQQLVLAPQQVQWLIDKGAVSDVYADLPLSNDPEYESKKDFTSQCLKFIVELGWDVTDYNNLHENPVDYLNEKVSDGNNSLDVVINAQNQMCSQMFNFMPITFSPPNQPANPRRGSGLIDLVIELPLATGMQQFHLRRVYFESGNLGGTCPTNLQNCASSSVNQSLSLITSDINSNNFAIVTCRGCSPQQTQTLRVKSTILRDMSRAFRAAVSNTNCIPQGGGALPSVSFPTSGVMIDIITGSQQGNSGSGGIQFLDMIQYPNRCQ